MNKRNDHSTTAQPATTGGDGATIEEGARTMKTPDHLVKKAPSTTNYEPPPVKLPSVTEQFAALFPEAHAWLCEVDGVANVDWSKSPNGDSPKVRGERPTFSFDGRPSDRQRERCSGDPGKGITLAEKLAGEGKGWGGNSETLDQLRFIEGLVRISLMTGDWGRGSGWRNDRPEEQGWRLPAVYLLALTNDETAAGILNVEVGALTSLRGRFAIPLVVGLDRNGVLALLSSTLDGEDGDQYEFAGMVVLRMADLWASGNSIGKILFSESLQAANFSELLREWLRMTKPMVGTPEFETEFNILWNDTSAALGEAVEETE